MAGKSKPLAAQKLDIDRPAWLVPRTLTAPAWCWVQPQVSIIAIAEPYVSVLLPNGTVLTKVHVDNVTHVQPREPVTRAKVTVPMEGEAPLW